MRGVHAVHRLAASPLYSLSVHLSHSRTEQIYHLLSQFLCSLLSPVNGQLVHSFLSHVTTAYLLGKPGENPVFTERNYLQFAEPLVQRVVFQFTQWFDHSLLSSVN